MHGLLMQWMKYLAISRYKKPSLGTIPPIQHNFRFNLQQNTMIKILLLCISALLLSSCADKEQYRQAILAQMQNEQDVKDYKIDPEKMAKCVLDLSAKKMPGGFPLDPDRMMAYRNYSKMLSMSTAKDKKKTFDELRTTFGSPRELAEAHSNYTESVMNCFTAILMESDDPTKSEEAAKPKKAAKS